MKYIVNIEEIVNSEYEVEANSQKEALALAKEKYYNGEFVNQPGNITFKQIAVAKENKNFREWKEF